MGLPASGPISSSQIGDYLGLSSPYSLRTMSSTAGFSTPDSASEFYNYQTQSDYLYVYKHPFPAYHLLVLIHMENILMHF